MIDIHTHTTCSDGTFTVYQLLAEAERKKLTLLSITDHNTVEAYKELENPDTRSLFSGDIITGVELSTSYNMECIEVLGYGIDISVMREFIAQNYYTFEEKMIKEYELIRDRYTEIGVKFDLNKVKADCDFKKRSSRDSFLKEMVRYPENLKFFFNKDSINNTRLFARMEVANPKSSLFVDETSLFPSLEKALEIIHKANGKAFIAHLFQYSDGVVNNLDSIIKEYLIDGIECYYSGFTSEQSEYLVNVCKDNGLFISGGSDFHGALRPNTSLGTGNNNLNINENTVNDWVVNYEKI